MYAWNPLFTAVGGGLGLLFGSVLAKGERVFDFKGDGEKRSEQWERLKRFVISGEKEMDKKIHLTIQGGQNFPGVSDRYMSLLEKSGYYVIRYTDTAEGWDKEVTNFNMLRKVQLTYSAMAKMEVGVAAYFIGEPALQAYPDDYYSLIQVRQSIDTKGYYAVAAFYPFRARTFKRFDWSVGMGVGVADVDFEFVSLIDWGWWYEQDVEKVDDYHLSKRFVSGVVFSELRFYIQKGFSVGLVADYVYVPKVSFPEFPGAGIPGQRLSLGNGCVGFTIGLHL
jgi:hypothetical protein